MTLDLDALDGVFAAPRRARPAPPPAPPAPIEEPSPGAYELDALEAADAAFVRLPQAGRPVAPAAPSPVHASPERLVRSTPLAVEPTCEAARSRALPRVLVALAAGTIAALGVAGLYQLGTTSAPIPRGDGSSGGSAGSPLPVVQARREPGRTVASEPVDAGVAALSRLSPAPGHREGEPAPSPSPEAPPPDQRWIVPFRWDQVDPGTLDPPAALRACATLRVVGHTCGLGEPDANEVIGLARAAAVRDALVAAGFDASTITIASAGESAPAASNATPEGRARNRRVETTCQREMP